MRIQRLSSSLNCFVGVVLMRPEKMQKNLLILKRLLDTQTLDKRLLMFRMLLGSISHTTQNLARFIDNNLSIKPNELISF